MSYELNPFTGQLDATSSGGSGDTLPVSDTTAVVKGSVDATKLVRIEADGVTTGTTRVLTMVDADLDLGNIPFANLADGTDGELITWDATGAPAVVAAGTATHVLTSNGAGAAPTFQAAAGGSPDSYAENGTFTTTPSATGTDSVAIGDGARSAGLHSIAIGKWAYADGEQSFSLFGYDGASTSYGAKGKWSVCLNKTGIASGQESFVACGNSTASANASTAFGPANTVSAPQGFAAGGNHTVSGAGYSACIGGNGNAASGSYSTIAGGYSSTSSGVESFVGGGDDNTASGLDSACIGGDNNVASASYSATLGGNYITAAGSWSVCAGGEVNTVSSGAEAAGIFAGQRSTITATGDNAVIIGGKYAKADKFGQICHGTGTVLGAMQESLFVLGGTTTNAPSSEVLGLTGVSGGSTMTVPTDTSWVYSALIVGTATTTASDSVAFELKGLIKNDGGTATAIGTEIQTVIARDTALDNCDAVGSVSGTSLIFTVTGDSDTAMRWAASVRVAEIKA